MLVIRDFPAKYFHPTRWLRRQPSIERERILRCDTLKFQVVIRVSENAPELEAIRLALLQLARMIDPEVHVDREEEVGRAPDGD